MHGPVSIHIRRQRLGVDAPSGTREQRLIQVAQEALDDPILHVINVAGTNLHGLGARFPEVAQALIRLDRLGSQASPEVENFAIRFNSAPLLSQMLHGVLSKADRPAPGGRDHRRGRGDFRRRPPALYRRGDA